METKKIAHCKSCGEVIPIPQARSDGSIICNWCYEDYSNRHVAKNKGAAERTDIDYHGGQFHNGEW